MFVFEFEVCVVFEFGAETEIKAGVWCGVEHTPVTDQNAGREVRNRKTAQHSTEQQKKE